MLNSINKNNEQGNNSIIPYSFIWTAQFKEKNELCQFDFETGKENSFKEVKDNFNQLIYFILWNKEKVFRVDLINGIIFFNTETQCKIDPDLLKEKKENIRLIYFSRHTMKMSSAGQEINHNLIYFLGFQYRDNNGFNRKIILQINSNGEFVIGSM
jgi:hypothetical protein